MKYEPRDIRQIKLINGEEIVAEVIGEDREELLIRNPLKVHREKFVNKGVAREANLFTTWMGFADSDEFFLQKNRIIMEAIVNDAVARHYNNMMTNVDKDNDVRVEEVDQAEHPDLLNIEDDEKDPTTFH